VGTREGIALTSFSHGAGCACKIGAAQLAEIRDALPSVVDPNLLVGLDPADDAAVYRLSDELALVQTVDFFTPIIDDPYEFGRVAAANALSDIYAMGAEPILALNLVAFSLERLGSDVLGQILAGGAAMAEDAGVAIAGGHSIDDPEPKYGMAVSGTVHPDRVLTKSGGNPGDDLYLTKPLGVGLIATAAKRGLASDALVQSAVAVMTELNAQPSRAAVELGATAMTDVTGFGLLGHLHELCRASNVSAEIDSRALPVIDGATELATNEHCVSGGSRRNASHAETFTAWADDVSTGRRAIASDAMTSGGLLIAIPSGAGPLDFGTRVGQLCRGVSGQVCVS
jgi:selenide,water dikinase